MFDVECRNVHFEGQISELNTNCSYLAVARGGIIGHSNCESRNVNPIPTSPAYSIEDLSHGYTRSID